MSDFLFFQFFFFSPCWGILHHRVTSLQDTHRRRIKSAKTWLSYGEQVYISVFLANYTHSESAHSQIEVTQVWQEYSFVNENSSTQIEMHEWKRIEQNRTGF